MESPLVARRDWPDVATATFDRVAASVRALRLAAFVAGLPAEQPASCHPTIRKCLKREVEVLEGGNPLPPARPTICLPSTPSVLRSRCRLTDESMIRNDQPTGMRIDRRRSNCLFIQKQ